MKQFFIRLYLSLMFLFASASCFGQYLEKLRSERPGKAISPFIPGRNVFQLESGIQYSRETSKAGFPEISSLVNNTLFRWGVLSNLELNAIYALRRDNVHYQDTLDYINSGFSDLQAGAKIQFLSGTKFSPTLAFKASVLLNFMSSPYNSTNAAPSFLFIVDQKINEDISFLGNIGMRWDGNNGSSEGNYALNISWELNDKISFMLENYGSLSNGDFDTFFNSGIGYIINNDFQIDLSVGYDYNDKVQNVFISSGFSWRFMRNYYYYQEYAQ